MSREFLYFEIEDVERILYPIACSVFQYDEYTMPELKWHDRERMLSALGALQNGYFEDIFDAAATLAYYVNKAHSLFDGNKRLTVIILYSFLLLNGYAQTVMTYGGVVDFTKQLAASESRDMDSVITEVKEYLKANVRRLSDQEYSDIFSEN